VLFLRLDKHSPINLNIVITKTQQNHSLSFNFQNTPQLPAHRSNSPSLSTFRFAQHRRGSFSQATRHSLVACLACKRREARSARLLHACLDTSCPGTDLRRRILGEGLLTFAHRNA
jgi:hypothetical protein